MRKKPLTADMVRKIAKLMAAAEKKATCYYCGKLGPDVFVTVLVRAHGGCHAKRLRAHRKMWA